MKELSCQIRASWGMVGGAQSPRIPRSRSGGVRGGGVCDDDGELAAWGYLESRMKEKTPVSSPKIRRVIH